MKVQRIRVQTIPMSKVHASDGALHDEQTITVNLTNVNDAPDALFLSNFLVTENRLSWFINRTFLSI